MIRRIVGLFCLVECLMIGHQALARQFSADVINKKTENEGPKKLYTGNGKERVEVESSNPMMGHTAVILENWGGCTRVGNDTLNGRSAIKYEGVSNKGEKGYIWVDTKLHCVVKTEDTSGGIELHNIEEGSQPASLFEIPAGYTKFEMGAMMRQRQ